MGKDTPKAATAHPVATVQIVPAHVDGASAVIVSGDQVFLASCEAVVTVTVLTPAILPAASKLKIEH